MNRHIDNLGRVSIPKAIRQAVGIENGDEVDFFLATDEDGNEFIGCRKFDRGLVEWEERKKIAADVLIKMGYDLPDELRAPKSSTE